MKFFSDRLFGHPVLNDTKDENNDYPSKVFDCGFEVKFSENDFTKYSIEYDFNLDSNILNYHIENGDIRFVLRISCNSTLYSSSEYCQQTGSIEIECNRLRQSVEFQGLLIAARSFKLVSNS